jgi:alanine dehydrogenase
MLIGVPKEIKPQENRVGLIPACVRELTRRGHEVIVEQGAGQGIGATDAHYRNAGARIEADVDTLFRAAELIVKVKEPLQVERKRLRRGQALFTYLHLAADKVLTDEVVQSGATSIAYETVTSPEGGLPLLAPMSEIAGRMSVQAAANCLETHHRGKGVLLGGAVGVEPSNVVILGGGIVGSNAASMALGLGASVTVVDRSAHVLRALNARFGDRLKTAFPFRETISRLLETADCVIIGVLVPGAAAPRLVLASDLKTMKPGSVLVDVAIDQGGGAETSRPTTHAEPTYVIDDIVHYCVANMPGAVARTSTYALNNATLPFVLDLADMGVEKALRTNVHLRRGLNAYRGELTNDDVAHALGLTARAPESALAEAA